MNGKNQTELERILDSANRKYQNLFGESLPQTIYFTSQEKLCEIVRYRNPSFSSEHLKHSLGFNFRDNIYVREDIGDKTEAVLLHEVGHYKFNRDVGILSLSRPRFIREVAAFFVQNSTAGYLHTATGLHSDAQYTAEIMLKYSDKPFSFWWKIITKARRLEEISECREYIEAESREEQEMIRQDQASIRYPTSEQSLDQLSPSEARKLRISTAGVKLPARSGK